MIVRVLRLLLSAFAVSFGAVGLVVAAPLQGSSDSPVYVVPIQGVVDEGMAHFVARAVADARSAHAAAIVLDVDTAGGLVAPAFEIRDSVLDSPVPTVAYVSRRAYSAGALIALAARTLVVAPGAGIGAAEPVPNDAHHVSALRAEFAATAERNGRNPTLAAAMVDKSVDAAAYKRSGAILTLAANEAVRAHIADAIAPSVPQALADAHLPTQPRVVAQYTLGERLARFATSPIPSGLLLCLGVLGLLVEMQTLHGIAGAVGIGALALFFGAHVYAGFSDGFVIVLALAGLAGILFELHVVPGHGLAGGLGLLALAAAVVLAFGVPFIVVAVQAIALALVLSALLYAVVLRMVPENAFFRRIAFTAAQGPDYVASGDRGALVGRRGVAASYLRPAGVAEVDGKRVDVLTEGEFVPAGATVMVSRVEGARVFVRPVVAASEEHA
ncbi:MAG: nodulation protein NfeD [Candidatus Eremiobacteraeota bacterium]|nr:nodulation protein NfeD [Candidatus Eremiobacteraeota bacterium]